MTTDNKDVSASPESPEAIAAQVSANAQAEGGGGVESTPAAESAPAVTLADLERTVNSFQGRQTNYTAGRMKEIEASLQTKIDEALAPVRELATRAEMAQVEQLEPEEQAEYWKNKATNPAPSQTVQPEVQPQVQPGVIAVEDQARIAREVQAFADQNNVPVSYLSKNVWQGATTNMPVDQLIQVAQSNILRMKSTPAPAAQPAQPAVGTPPPPTSTQQAPASTGTVYGSRTEAQQALLNGDIANIDEFQRIGRTEGWLK